MTDQNSATATTTPMTLDIRLGSKRLTCIATKRNVSRKRRASAIRIAKTFSAIRPTSSGYAESTGSSCISSRIEFCHCTDRQRKTTATTVQPMAAASLAIRRRRSLDCGSSMYVHSQWPNTPMPYPAASDNPESTPWVTKLCGSSVGVRAAAKNSVPRRKPPAENKRHSPLPIPPCPRFQVNVSAACRARRDGTSHRRGSCGRARIGMPLRAANVAPTTADQSGHYPKFLGRRRPARRRHRAVGPHPIEKAETPRLRVLEVARTQWGRAYELPAGFMAPLLPLAKLGGGWSRTSLPCCFLARSEDSREIAQRALCELARL